MKILYITNHLQILRAGGFLNDYLNDLLFFGLTEIKDVEVIDSTPIIHLYKQYKDNIPNHLLWGKGFTSTYLLDSDNLDRSDLEKKIADKYFDLIIYGAVNRCLDYYDLIVKVYPKDKIFLIDGSDTTDVHVLSKSHPYFKRELKTNEFIPIHFSIPESKIAKRKLEKIQDYGTIIPGEGLYKFDIESLYYDDYNKSYFGVTMKKAGWDCMRHYEILANNCIPYFIGLEECPEYTLTNLPKELLFEAKDLANNFNETKYYSMLEEFATIVKENLTTKKLANYVLSYV